MQYAIVRAEGCRRRRRICKIFKDKKARRRKPRIWVEANLSGQILLNLHVKARLQYNQITCTPLLNPAVLHTYRLTGYLLSRTSKDTDLPK